MARNCSTRKETTVSKINFALRVEPETYEKIRKLAERNERSINQTINILLRQATQGKKK